MPLVKSDTYENIALTLPEYAYRQDGIVKDIVSVYYIVDYFE